MVFPADKTGPQWAGGLGQQAALGGPWRPNESLRMDPVVLTGSPGSCAKNKGIRVTRSLRPTDAGTCAL